MTKRALLIGAGFSYDLGMPLATDFTKGFLKFFNESRMRECLEIWKTANPYGSDRPIDPKAMDDVYNIYKSYIRNPNSNYEEFLKEIQRLHNDPRAKQDYRDAAHYIFGRFFDAIVELFWRSQLKSYPMYKHNKKFYESFSNFLSEKELWVLSLNHDLLIEFLCLDNKIPFSFGEVEQVTFPLNKESNDFIDFSLTPRSNMQIDRMNFIRNHTGVNLIKLHGAINEFTYNDDKNVLHVKPIPNDTSASYLKRVDDVLHRMTYDGENSLPVIGEIVVSNLKKEVEFFRKSILTGGFKYSETFDPKPGEEKMSLLEEVLLNVDELTIIGYSFCDNHINLRLNKSMILNEKLKIVVVDPFNTEIPEVLKPFNYQKNTRIKRVTCGTPEWMYYMKHEEWNTKDGEELKLIRGLRKRFALK